MNNHDESDHWDSLAFELIGDERCDQVAGGFTSSHDDEHDSGELRSAALAVLAREAEYWPFDEASLTRIENRIDRSPSVDLLGDACTTPTLVQLNRYKERLVISGALVVAELGRVLRAIEKEEDVISQDDSVLVPPDHGITNAPALRSALADLRESFETLQQKLNNLEKGITHE